MNVLFVTMVDPSGKSGENIYSKEVAAAFARNPSVNLSMICPKPLHAELPELGIHLKNVRYLPPKIPRQFRWHLKVQYYMFKALRDLIVAEKPDLIVATLKASLILPPLIAKWHRIPYILLVEGLVERNVKRMRLFPGIHSLVKILVKIVEWLNARCARDVYAAYEEVKQRYDSLRTSAQRETQLFQVPVDPDLFQPTPIAAAREQLNLPVSKNDFVVGFVGSFKPRHALSPLIKAVASIQERIPNIKLLLVGEGPECENIKSLVQQEDLEDKVIFTGFIPHHRIPTYIAACDVIYSVITPGYSSNPMKCYESLACERPVIVRDTPDLEFIAENDFGTVIKSAEPCEIADAIRCLYEIGQEARLNIGRAGRRYVLECRTWDRLVNLILGSVDS